MKLHLQLCGFHWRLKGGNRKILAHSEQYASRSNCRRAARRVAEKLRLPIVERKPGRAPRIDWDHLRRKL